MTFQISQRGKKYLKTARTLLRAAQAMTDYAIAGQLKDSGLRKLRRLMRPRHWLVRRPTPKASGMHKPRGGYIVHR
jgi:hypothetical protein